MRASAKYRSAARVSARLIAASSPQVNASGNAILAISAMNQRPLASPCEAEMSVFSVIGADSGSATEVDSISP